MLCPLPNVTAEKSPIWKKNPTPRKDLAHTVAGFGDAMRQVNWQEVQRNLAAGEAAVEFVHYGFVEIKQTDSIMYAALLLLPEAQQPIFILLFEEKSLDSLLHYKSERKADYVNSLYTLPDRGAIAIEAPKNHYMKFYGSLWRKSYQVLKPFIFHQLDYCIESTSMPFLFLRQRP